MIYNGGLQLGKTSNSHWSRMNFHGFSSTCHSTKMRVLLAVFNVQPVLVSPACVQINDDKLSADPCRQQGGARQRRDYNQLAARHDASKAGARTTRTTQDVWRPKSKEETHEASAWRRQRFGRRGGFNLELIRSCWVKTTLGRGSCIPWCSRLARGSALEALLEFGASFYSRVRKSR